MDSNTRFKNTRRRNKFIHIYTWKAPERYWTLKDKVWYLKVAMLFVFLIFFAALTGQNFLILALISLLLLLFTQATIPPKVIRHEITNRGIKSFNDFFKWKDIDYFWITEKDETGFMHWFNKDGEKYRLVNFEMPNRGPSRLSLLIGDGDEEEIVFTLLEYIPYAESDEVSDDIISKLIYGKHIPFRDYAPEFEEVFLDETIEEFEEPKDDSKPKDENERNMNQEELEKEELKQREEKRKKQIEARNEHIEKEVKNIKKEIKKKESSDKQ